MLNKTTHPHTLPSPPWVPHQEKLHLSVTFYFLGNAPHRFSFFVICGTNHPCDHNNITLLTAEIYPLKTSFPCTGLGSSGLLFPRLPKRNISASVANQVVTYYHEPQPSCKRFHISNSSVNSTRPPRIIHHFLVIKAPPFEAAAGWCSLNYEYRIDHALGEASFLLTVNSVVSIPSASMAIATCALISSC